MLQAFLIVFIAECLKYNLVFTAWFDLWWLRHTFG